MKRRNFLRTLGISALAVPVAIEAVKGVEVPKTVSTEDEALLESLHHNAYVQHFNECKEHIEQGFDWQTINLIAPVKPSKAGEAIYIYTDEDKLRIHNVIHIPAKYFDDKSASDLPQVYYVAYPGRLLLPQQYYDIKDLLPGYVCTCYPLLNNLALTKEIPVTQKLIIGASALKPEEL